VSLLSCKFTLTCVFGEQIKEKRNIGAQIKIFKMKYIEDLTRSRCFEFGACMGLSTSSLVRVKVSYNMLYNLMIQKFLFVIFSSRICTTIAVADKTLLKNHNTRELEPVFV
jgi:hypothetical protein